MCKDNQLEPCWHCGTLIAPEQSCGETCDHLCIACCDAVCMAEGDTHCSSLELPCASCGVTHNALWELTDYSVTIDPVMLCQDCELKPENNHTIDAYTAAKVNELYQGCCVVAWPML